MVVRTGRAKGDEGEAMAGEGREIEGYGGTGKWKEV